jgi:hypothetical protein
MLNSVLPPGTYSLHDPVFHTHPFFGITFLARKQKMHIPTPPDLPKEQSGTLSTLSIQGVGPAKKLDLHLAERINLLTGDNGLGKSFVLECAWWVLSGNWNGFPAYPRTDADKNEPENTALNMNEHQARLLRLLVPRYERLYSGSG